MFNLITWFICLAIGLYFGITVRSDAMKNLLQKHDVTLSTMKQIQKDCEAIALERDHYRQEFIRMDIERSE